MSISVADWLIGKNIIVMFCITYSPEVLHGSHSAETVLGVSKGGVNKQLLHDFGIVVHACVCHSKGHYKSFKKHVLFLATVCLFLFFCL